MLGSNKKYLLGLPKSSYRLDNAYLSKISNGERETSTEKVIGTPEASFPSPSEETLKLNKHLAQAQAIEGSPGL